MFRKILEPREDSKDVEIFFTDTKKEKVEREQILENFGAIILNSKFEMKIYVLLKDECGRHITFLIGYCPNFYFRRTDVNR
jgi:elongation factor Tu